MNVFSAGTDVALSVLLQDASGNPLPVTAVSYRVTDQDGRELVPLSSLASFTEGATTASIEVSAAENTLAVGVAHGLRMIELTCTIGANKVTLHESYAIENGEPLVVGVNSFMTYAQAEFTALAVPNLDGWNSTDERTRMAALQDARSHIAQLAFATDSIDVGQNHLGYSFSGRPTNHYGFSGNLEVLTPAEFAKLPARFLEALRKAQLVEADSILGGNGVEQKRREGLIQDNIGESRQMFRQTKPLELPVCRRALGYLSNYVTFAKRIGRA